MAQWSVDGTPFWMTHAHVCACARAHTHTHTHTHTHKVKNISHSLMWLLCTLPLRSLTAVTRCLLTQWCLCVCVKSCFQHGSMERYLNLILVNKFAQQIFWLSNTIDFTSPLMKRIRCLLPSEIWKYLKRSPCTCLSPSPCPGTIWVSPPNPKTLSLLRWFLGCLRGTWV